MTRALVKTLADFVGWTSPAYNGADFTASAGSWTVEAGDVETRRYMILDKAMTYVVSLRTTSVSATPNQLGIAIPAGKVATAKMGGAFMMLDNSAPVFSLGYWQVDAGGTIIRLFLANTSSNFATSASLSGLNLHATFQIN